MYLDHYGLTEPPFSIAPDPRYLYLSQRHQEALAHLLYGIRGEGGFVLLTGEVGTGKTTVCRCVLEQIPDSCDVAYVFNPKLTSEDLLQTICDEFGIPVPEGNASTKVFIDAINAYLLDGHARGRHAVLIIDEAQNLSADVLEQMRLLTNLETSRRKLLQIILLGQPELSAMLARPELRQLAQRIVARYHLGPLTADETAAYVAHRLQVAGARQAPIPASLAPRIHRLSSGVPRVINLICDRALLGAYAQGLPRVDGPTLAQAAAEVLGRPPTVPRRWTLVVAGGLLVTMGAIAVARYAPEPATTDTAATAPSAAAPPPRPVSPKSESVAPTAARLEWPAGTPRGDSRRQALSALLAAWGIADDGRDACRQAENQGLLCRTGVGNLDELRAYDTPAVLAMRDARGQPLFHAALVGLDAGGARFALGGEIRNVALAAIAGQWSGEYTLLWRMPPEARRKLRPGERGPAVAWLAERLAAAQGRPADIGHVSYDDALVRHVREFQLAEGLIPDGSAGPQTLIRLGARADRQTPKLSGAPGKP